MAEGIVHGQSTGVQTVNGVVPDLNGNVDLSDWLKTWSLKANFPVGYVWISFDATSPASIVGGNWEKLPGGRFLVATGTISGNSTNYFGAITGGWDVTVGEKGGQDYHTLTVAEMPPHNHNVGVRGGSGAYPWYSWNFSEGWNTNWYASETQSSGGGLKHNNMPPYIGVYMWKRIS